MSAAFPGESRLKLIKNRRTEQNCTAREISEGDGIPKLANERITGILVKFLKSTHKKDLYLDH